MAGVTTPHVGPGLDVGGVTSHGEGDVLPLAGWSFLKKKNEN